MDINAWTFVLNHEQFKSLDLETLFTDSFHIVTCLLQRLCRLHKSLIIIFQINGSKELLSAISGFSTKLTEMVGKHGKEPGVGVLGNTHHLLSHEAEIKFDHAHALIGQIFHLLVILLPFMDIYCDFGGCGLFYYLLQGWHVLVLVVYLHVLS